MPKIIEYFGFIFFFYSNEHEPIHVHVIHQDCESVFDLIIENGILIDIIQRNAAGVDPLPAKDVKTAKDFIRKYYKNIVNKWVSFFVLKKIVKCTKIKSKL